MISGLRNRAGLGDADAIEPKRTRLAGKRGLQIGGGELNRRVQKSRSA
jgi:hypothetical protein